jgi:hypothetical protein
MKYYIAYEQKKDFHLLGHLSPISFKPAQAYKVLKEYISEFPGLLIDVKVVDEKEKSITLNEFLKKVEEYDNN